MNAIEFLETTRRMCREYTGCAECPLCGAHNMCALPHLEGKSARNTVDIVEKWAQEQPERPYKTVFLEKFPDAEIDPKTATPRSCLKNIFGESHGACSLSSCRDCWNRPYPEEDS